MTGPERRTRAGTTLVTGVTGFIGSRLASRLLERGEAVRGLVRRPGAGGGVEEAVGDMLDHESLERAVAGVERVVHLAVDESGELERGRAVNVEGTRALAEASLAAGCSRFVHVSTCGVYALEGVDVVSEETPLWPEERASELVYGVTKAAAERALAAVADRGLSLVVLRPPNVLGAHARNAFCERLATLVRDGEVRYAGDGGNTWPYVHVENLLDAIESALDLPLPSGRAYTVVDGHTTWRAFLEDHAAWFGVEVGTRERRPPYDAVRGRFATDRARGELGYRPRLGYADALEETRRYLQGAGLLARPEEPAGT